ncbi:MAG: NFACT RNA binding domain-containing protein, partial [Armatimonadota bacterium]|nr:NFACT RNA binding domain-containing protein [Armatimonadota bacterium]
MREVRPGLPYLPPPTPTRLNPALATTDEVRAVLAGEPAAPVGECLSRSFQLGPTVLAVVLSLCGVDAATPASAVDPDAVAAALRRVTDASAYRPALVYDLRGVPSGVSFVQCEPQHPAPQSGEGNATRTASQVLEAYYQYHIAHEELETRRGSWLRLLDAAVRFSQRRLREAEEGIAAAAEAPNLEREAALLMANLNRIPRGASQATVVDFYDAEQREVTIPLDPAVPAREQAERRFRRARKLRDALPHLRRQQEEEEARLRALQEVRPALETAASEGALAALEPALRELGVFREGAAGPAGAAATRAVAAGVQRRVIGGFEVLLGRNASENDHLTRHLADPDDLWLHARGITSAHVVIRTGKHPEKVPHAVLMEAAKLCALHSQARHSRLVPVDYTLRKYVV